MYLVFLVQIQWYEFLGKNLEFLPQKLKKILKIFKNTTRFVIIRSILLDNLTFYLPETMLKPTETSKKVKIF